MEPESQDRPQQPITEAHRTFFMQDVVKREHLDRQKKIEEILSQKHPYLEEVLDCMTANPKHSESLSDDCKKFCSEQNDQLLKIAFGVSDESYSQSDRNRYAVIATHFLVDEKESTRQFLVPRIDPAELTNTEMEFERGDESYSIAIHDFSMIDTKPFNSVMEVFSRHSADPFSDDSIGAVGNAARILQAQIDNKPDSLQAINMIFSSKENIPNILKHLSNPRVVSFLNTALLSIPKLANGSEDEDEEWTYELTDNRVYMFMKITDLLLDKDEDPWTVKGAAECLEYLIDNRERTSDGDTLVRNTFFEAMFCSQLVDRICSAGVRHALLRVLHKLVQFALPDGQTGNKAVPTTPTEEANNHRRRKSSIYLEVNTSCVLTEKKDTFILMLLDDFLNPLVSVLREVVLNGPQGIVGSDGKFFHIKFGQDVVELVEILVSAFLARRPGTDDKYLQSGMLEILQEFFLAPHLNNQIHNCYLRCILSALEQLNTTAFNYLFETKLMEKLFATGLQVCVTDVQSTKRNSNHPLLAHLLKIGQLVRKIHKEQNFVSQSLKDFYLTQVYKDFSQQLVKPHVHKITGVLGDEAVIFKEKRARIKSDAAERLLVDQEDYSPEPSGRNGFSGLHVAGSG